MTALWRSKVVVQADLQIAVPAERMECIGLCIGTEVEEIDGDTGGVAKTGAGFDKHRP